MKGSLWEYLDEVEARLRTADKFALFLDFDGTLAAIQADPSQVALDPAAAERLRRLAAMPDVLVAVVSGRELDDVRNRVGVPGVTYAGNHGLEIAAPTGRFVEPAALAHAESLGSLASALSSKLTPIAGAQVEDKGLSLAVHYRQAADDQGEAVRRIVHAALAAADHPFQLTAGNKVFDIRPRVYWTKGDAVAWIRERAAPGALAMYVGDDATDEDAFGSLPDDITVKVGEGKASLAQYCVDDPHQVLRLLTWLADAAPGQPKPIRRSGGDDRERPPLA